MSAEENKMVIRRYTDEVLNQGNMDTLDQVLAGNFTNHDPGNPGVVSRDDYKQFVTALRTAFPDLHFTHEDEVADGDEVAVRWTMRGTNRGELAMPEGPVPPLVREDFLLRRFAKRNPCIRMLHHAVKTFWPGLRDQLPQRQLVPTTERRNQY